ncbi:MAG: YggS family pyridoxal phosphate-dependent enzyme [Acidobacteria bacterium]|nr:YggS family pyridoxal phosphate-dependent enzyme [Acidobacteriota bacterium]MBV9624518.1 YggS family pyridoxal phosphate-dependent enzyme [Acidobacteriota bacterium]
MPIAENVLRIREEIAAAARGSGRNPEEISLMAVTKGVAPDQIRQACDAGIRLLGENRVQEFCAKVPLLGGLEGIRRHLIGHLQSNKVLRALEVFEAVDSLDSVRLARKLDRAAADLQKRVSVLIEINIGRETGKSGMAADSAELADLLRLAPEMPALEIRGLMTVPPFADNPEQSRPYFRQMRELFCNIQQRKLPAVRMDVLSMGMSHDFAIAIAEGATCVRIGTAIFGERKAMRRER